MDHLKSFFFAALAAGCAFAAAADNAQWIGADGAALNDAANWSGDAPFSGVSTNNMLFAKGTPSDDYTVRLDGEKTFNRIQLQEYIPLGQRIAAFRVEALDTAGEWAEIARGTTVGYKRILLTDRITTRALRIRIDEALACPVLNGLGLYLDEVLGGAAFTWEKAEVAGRKMKAAEPVELDLKELRTIGGFFYEPIHGGAEGCIVSYDLETSRDGIRWEKRIADRLFENVVNNPIRQEVRFDEPVEARYLRLVPVRTSLPGQYGVAGFGAL